MGILAHSTEITRRGCLGAVRLVLREEFGIVSRGWLQRKLHLFVLYYCKVPAIGSVPQAMPLWARVQYLVLQQADILEEDLTTLGTLVGLLPRVQPEMPS